MMLSLVLKSGYYFLRRDRLRRPVPRVTVTPLREIAHVRHSFRFDQHRRRHLRDPARGLQRGLRRPRARLELGPGRLRRDAGHQRRPGPDRRLRRASASEEVDADAVHAHQVGDLPQAPRRGRCRAPARASSRPSRPPVATACELGLVTTTSPENVHALVEALSGTVDLASFDVVVDSSQVSAGKPDGEAYTFALTRWASAATRRWPSRTTWAALESATVGRHRVRGLPQREHRRARLRAGRGEGRPARLRRSARTGRPGLSDPSNRSEEHACPASAPPCARPRPPSTSRATRRSTSAWSTSPVSSRPRTPSWPTPTAPSAGA